jgi:hypothetical protein
LESVKVSDLQNTDEGDSVKRSWPHNQWGVDKDLKPDTPVWLHRLRSL